MRDDHFTVRTWIAMGQLMLAVVWGILQIILMVQLFHGAANADIATWTCYGALGCWAAFWSLSSKRAFLDCMAYACLAGVQAAAAVSSLDANWTLGTYAEEEVLSTRVDAALRGPPWILLSFAAMLFFVVLIPLVLGDLLSPKLVPKNSTSGGGDE